MRSVLRKVTVTLFCIGTLVVYNNCGGGFQPLKVDLSSTQSAGFTTPLPVVGTESNVLPVTIGCGYTNEPCVSVTICTPGTNTCQTISNILLDTGSYGLRLYSSLVTVGLTTTTVGGGGSLAQCVSYADGSSDWGPVKKADIVLGKERAANVPVQIIDSNFSGIPSDCTKPDASPSATGFNGILGIGPLIQDCGASCETIVNNRIYFSCTGANCTPSTATLTQQVANPVSFLPINNNGTALQLPVLPEAGSASANGFLVLGIGTQANNTPAGVHFLQTDNTAKITTEFNGQTYSAFIDSGSNGIYFPGPSSLADCSANSGAPGFYCPSVNTNFSAVQIGISGSPRVSVPFQVTNAESAMAATNPNIAFSNLGGSASGSFDWGLPFFFGRTVFNGIEGKTSPLGTGPYMAY